MHIHRMANGGNALAENLPESRGLTHQFIAAPLLPINQMALSNRGVSGTGRRRGILSNHHRLISEIPYAPCITRSDRVGVDGVIRRCPARTVRASDYIEELKPAFLAALCNRVGNEKCLGRAGRSACSTQGREVRRITDTVLNREDRFGRIDIAHRLHSRSFIS